MINRLSQAVHSLRKQVRNKIWRLQQEAKMRVFYRQFIQPGDLAFDVGANIGSRTGVFLRLGARVVAVEPQSHCVAKIRKMHGRNPNLTIFQGGLADKPGELTLHVSSNSAISSMAPDWMDALKGRDGWETFRWETTQIVPVTTLDALIAQHGRPAFVKIDVEGFELPVLRGLSSPVKALSFEYTPEYLSATHACLDHLIGLGPYRFNFSVKESMAYALPSWVGPADLWQALLNVPVKNRSGDVYAVLREAHDQRPDLS
jgi:FkbM family methyltransferase